MLHELIERAAEARLRRVMFALQAGPHTARHFGYPTPPTPPPIETIRANILEGCKRDAEAGLLEREVSWPCRHCAVFHNINDYCPLKVPTW